jgi:uncharacterized protein (UPF0210 family)
MATSMRRRPNSRGSLRSTRVSVCGTGLDTVPLPGEISEQGLAKIFGDVAALAWKWHKPLTARLQPVANKKAGEATDFDSQYLFNTTEHQLQ